MEYDYEFLEQSPAKPSQKQLKKELLARAVKDLQQQGITLNPIEAVGRKKFVHAFWARNWLLHLTKFEQVDHRLKMGRSLFRQVGLLDWHINGNQIHAYAWDQETYKTSISFATLDDQQKESLKSAISLQVDSILSLLTGDISEELGKQIVGIFPSLDEIHFSCNCLDFADFCSHSAAALYGFAMHLEKTPQDFFTLRGLDLASLWDSPNSDHDLNTNSMSSVDLETTFSIDIDLSQELNHEH